MNKKAIELSINFIVIIIISLVVFSFGVRYIYQLGSEANKLKDMAVEELDRKIGSLACEGSERVCLGIGTKTIKKGHFDVFGLRITNVLDDNYEFNIEVNSSTIVYTKKGEEIISDENKLPKLKYRTEPFLIKQNEESDLGIGVEIPKNAKSGTYVLDVKVYPYYTLDNTTLYQIYVDVP